MSDYNYDESGHLWPFFVFTLSFVLGLPLTWLLWRRTRAATAVSRRGGPKSTAQLYNAAMIEADRESYQRTQRNIGLAITVFLFWAVMAYMLYLIQTTPAPENKLWNPYDILGISEDATEKVIKKTYKELSRRLHPDKAKPDPARNETVDSLNAVYVEISKAYQALTDEDIRNNYQLYGHPDGKQGYSINIALPKIMVSDGNGKYVVLFYFVLFGVALPYLVGSWWYGTQRMSKEGVLMKSADRLFRLYEDDIDEGGVITALGSGEEFRHKLKGDQAESGLAAVESKITSAGETSVYAAGLSVKDKEKLEDLESGANRKALALLWAYLGRVRLDDPALERAKVAVAPVAHALTRPFTEISRAYGSTAPLLASYHAMQLIVQAIPPKASPLLQLPFVTPAIAKAIEGDSKVRTTIQKFMDQPDVARRRAAVGKGRLTEEQYKETLRIARELPYFRVAKAFFKVAGEKYIIPSSLVTLVVKGRFIPPGSEKVPEINELDLEDVDPAEDDLDAILGRKPKKIGKDENGKPIVASAQDDEPILPPPAFAPGFPRDVSPRWHVFLADSKQGRIAVPPFTFGQFDKPIFGEDGTTPTFNMQTLKAQFQAPPQAGHYTFVMHVVCDSYVGFDTKMEVTLVVDDASKADEVEEEEEISEPEEDSLAGIMNAAKGGAPPPRRKKTEKTAEKEDESDDESGTEEEADDTSDTNTDTEPED